MAEANVPELFELDQQSGSDEDTDANIRDEQDDVQLSDEVSGNSMKKSYKNWKPFDFAARSEEEQLYGIVRRILNKLTPKNLDNSIKQIKALDIRNAKCLRRVTYLIFEKAIFEPFFPDMFSILCKQLADIECVGKIKYNNDVKQFNFKYLLLKECQMEMKKISLNLHRRSTKVNDIGECIYPEEKQELKLQLKEFDDNIKDDSIRFFRFIGGLFKQNIISPNVILEYVDMLIENEDEISLECLCVFLTMIGKDLEVCWGRNLEYYFEILQKTIDNKNISYRIKFMLEELIAKRNNMDTPWTHNLHEKAIDYLLREVTIEKREPFETKWNNSYQIGGNFRFMYKGFIAELEEVSPDNIHEIDISEISEDDEHYFWVLHLIYGRMIESFTPSDWCAKLKKKYVLWGPATLPEDIIEKFQNLFNIYVRRHVPYIMSKVDQHQEKQLQEEYNKTRMHMTAVRTIKFLGEFFMKNLIDLSVIMDIIQKLLQDKNEINLDCLCVLLTIVGRHLEKRKSQDLTEIFHQLEMIAKDRHSSVSKRIRIKLQIIINMRSPKWRPPENSVKLEWIKVNEDTKIQKDIEQCPDNVVHENLTENKQTEEHNVCTTNYSEKNKSKQSLDKTTSNISKFGASRRMYYM